MKTFFPSGRAALPLPLLPLLVLLLSLAGAACADRSGQDASGDDGAVGTTGKRAGDAQPLTVKPSPPISLAYRIVGTPAVNEPLRIELDIAAATTGEPVAHFTPRGELALGKSQPEQLALKTATGAAPAAPQTREVLVVPLQEGRSYLNVLIEAQHEGQPVAKAVAIPIQTGDAPPVMDQNGVEMETDGEIVNSLPASRGD